MSRRNRKLSERRQQLDALTNSYELSQEHSRKFLTKLNCATREERVSQTSAREFAGPPLCRRSTSSARDNLSGFSPRKTPLATAFLHASSRRFFSRCTYNSALCPIQSQHPRCYHRCGERAVWPRCHCYSYKSGVKPLGAAETWGPTVLCAIRGLAAGSVTPSDN